MEFLGTVHGIFFIKYFSFFFKNPPLAAMVMDYAICLVSWCSLAPSIGLVCHQETSGWEVSALGSYDTAATKCYTR